MNSIFPQINLKPKEIIYTRKKEFTPKRPKRAKPEQATIYIRKKIEIRKKQFPSIYNRNNLHKKGPEKETIYTQKKKLIYTRKYTFVDENTDTKTTFNKYIFLRFFIFFIFLVCKELNVQSQTRAHIQSQNHTIFYFLLK